MQRFVLMSALGTSEAAAQTVPYFAAKWAEERDVAASGLEYTIFRPSFVFGRDGGALPTFMRQVQLLARRDRDRRRACSARSRSGSRTSRRVLREVAIDLPEAANRTFELGGPDTVDWNGLYRTIAKVLGKRRRLVHVPIGARAHRSAADRAAARRAAAASTRCR